jgi:flagellar basal-body rod protein FlgB
MDPKQIGLFDLAERRLAWINQRQAVLAQNIANANTPRYKPHDLRPFTAALGRAHAVIPMRTQHNHLLGTSRATAPNEVVDRTHTQSPDGNAVALEEQLVKVADTESKHAMVTAIYRKYLGMFSIAMGRGPSG